MLHLSRQGLCTSGVEPSCTVRKKIFEMNVCSFGSAIVKRKLGIEEICSHRDGDASSFFPSRRKLQVEIYSERARWDTHCCSYLGIDSNQKNFNFRCMMEHVVH
ncbi:unnamed protein product [Arabidopsis arenosa]|uniref:Uncharacterized protein n=1 Tax=Arabidopsis arenosa TaxID=38785 RepID=A0A8S1ZK26_ARAAE|nr:unnamed protein product [Arabidopsis arenosa]